MKAADRIIWIVSLCLIIGISCFAQEQQKAYQMNSINDKGSLAPKENFTGTVWVNMAVNPDDNLNSVIGKVTFEPRARTNWHTHPHGQILIVTNGIGYYQEKGKPVQVIKTGDVVKIPVGVEHWHGGSHTSAMTHIAIVPSATNGSIWLTPVTDGEYNAAKSAGIHPQTPGKLSEKALEIHEQLWPDYASKAATTDPELIEVFDNFAFDDVIGHSNMDHQTRTLLIIAATIGSQAVTEFKMFVNAALNVGVSPVKIKEVVYQAVPYVGIAKVIDFLYTTNELFKERNIALPVDGQSTTDRSNRHEKGIAKQKEIVGADLIDGMYQNSPADLIHIQEYLSANCFGDYITRNGLDVKERELITLSFLIALGGTESQIKGHIRGNANVGNDRQTMINAITQLLPYVGYPRTLNAIACLNEILPTTK